MYVVMSTNYNTVYHYGGTNVHHLALSVECITGLVANVRVCFHKLICLCSELTKFTIPDPLGARDFSLAIIKFNL